MSNFKQGVVSTDDCSSSASQVLQEEERAAGMNIDALSDDDAILERELDNVAHATLLSRRNSAVMIFPSMCGGITFVAMTCLTKAIARAWNRHCAMMTFERRPSAH
jgi:hypothetical protein